MTIIYFCVFAFSVSCGYQLGSYQYSETNSENQPIVHSEGWGIRYKYPIVIHLSDEIEQENLHLSKQIMNAMNSWNNAIGKKILTLKVENKKQTENDFSSLYSPLSHINTAIYFDKINANKGGWKESTGKNKNIIASTIFDSDKHTIFKAAIRFNRDNYIFGNTKTDQSNGKQILVDMESIALHELGHILGLGHMPNESSSVMYPFINTGPDSNDSPSTVRCLSKNDIRRVRSIYLGGKEAKISCLQE